MSEHFSYESQVFSQTAERNGIDNRPNAQQRASMTLTAAYMEVVRVMLGSNPITTSSWFRGPELNKKIGGSEDSQHSKGQAVDFTCCGYGSVLSVCEVLAVSSLPYDQLIYEGRWVHISFVLGMARREILTATFEEQGVTYVEGLVGRDT